MDSTTAWLHDFLARNAVMIEVTLLVLSFVSIVLYYFDIPSSNLYLVRSVNLIAILYLFLASFEGKDYQITNISYRVKGIGFSVAILAAMFKLLNYPGQEMLLKIAVFSMPIAVLIWGFNSRRNWSNNLVALIIRIALFTTLGLVLWFL